MHWTRKGSGNPHFSYPLASAEFIVEVTSSCADSGLWSLEMGCNHALGASVPGVGNSSVGTGVAARGVRQAHAQPHLLLAPTTASWAGSAQVGLLSTGR